tara:strand:- start:336 stop:719 length:384 start_codon:yes stop_codon:yes gene_type:complete
MFFSGVVLTHAVFYLDKKRKQKRFYIFMSASILQVLDSIDLVHKTAIDFIAEQSKTLEESQKQKYLEEEGKKLSTFMELYVLLFINAVPPAGRKYVSFRSWSEAHTLIKKMRGFLQNEKSKGRTLES